MSEVKEIYQQLKDKKVNPRDLKMKLAFEIVKINLGKKAAMEAQDYFVKTIQRKEAPDEIKSRKLKVKSINIVELLNEVGLAKSKGEARRLIAQNGIKIDGKVVGDVEMEVEIDKKGILLQRGKRQFLRVINPD